MSVCSRCNGRKYIELDKIGLLITDCPECNGTGEIDDSDSGAGRPDSITGSGNTGKPKLKRKSKTTKKAREGTG